MEVQGLYAIAAAVAIGFAALASAIGDALVAVKVLEGTVRQPELRGQLMTTMFIAVGLIEAMPIIAAVIAIFLVFTKL